MSKFHYFREKDDLIIHTDFLLSLVIGDIEGKILMIGIRLQTYMIFLHDRYLMKSYRAGLEGSPVSPSVQYLTARPAMHQSPPLSNQGTVSPRYTVHIRS